MLVESSAYSRSALSINECILLFLFCCAVIEIVVLEIAFVQNTYLTNKKTLYLWCCINVAYLPEPLLKFIRCSLFTIIELLKFWLKWWPISIAFGIWWEGGMMMIKREGEESEKRREWGGRGRVSCIFKMNISP